MSPYAEDDRDDYYVPLVDQRVFGAGIKRKRIAFVPATSEPSSAANTSTPTTGKAGDRYLSIVLKKASSPQSDTDKKDQADSISTEPALSPSLCPVCGQALTEADNNEKPHESSIAHQVCLGHSHAPSHLDRSHVGLKYLRDFGWDPDARIGLGARAEGIRIPIKAKEKHDSAGLGMAYDQEEHADKVKQPKKVKVAEGPARLNAKQIRKIEDEKSRKAESLRRNMYGPDLSQYLGSDA